MKRFLAMVLSAAMFVLALSLCGTACAAQFVGTWKYQAFPAVNIPGPQWVDQSEWQPFDYPRRPKLSKDTVHIYYTITISPDDIDRDTILFYAQNQAVRVWLGNEVLYESGDFVHIDDSKGDTWHMVTLPDFYGEQMLTIELFGGDKSVLGNIKGLRLESAMYQVRELFMHDALYVSSMPIDVALILILLVYYFTDSPWKEIYKRVLIFLVLFAFWLVAASNWKMFFMPYALFWTYALFILNHVVIMAANCMGLAVMDRGISRHLNWTVYGFVVLLIVDLARAIFFEINFYDLYEYYYAFMAVAEAFVIGGLIISARNGNAFSKGMLTPFVVTVLLGLFDFINIYFLRIQWLQTYTASLGAYTFVVFILVLLNVQLSHDAELAAKTRTLRVRVNDAVKNSEIDPLTHCYNRRKLKPALEEAIAVCSGGGEPLSLLMLDIDHFKHINDRYGHDEGDKALVGFAETIRKEARESDLIVRWGGEEFLILLKDVELGRAYMIAERIRKSVESAKILPYKQITCSIGVVEWHGDTPEGLFKRVDWEVYQAKHNGRNTVCMERNVKDGE